MYITKDYIDLQVKFVNKLCQLDDAPFELYFMFYADAPLLLKIDYKTWHPHESVYMDFVKSTSSSQDLTTAIYEFSLEREKLLPTELYTNNPYGYFHCGIHKGAKVLELHTLSEAPLKKDTIHFLDHRRYEETRNNLYKMIQDEKIKHPTLKTVTGNSWLYNISAYRKLFPDEYLATAKPNTHSFHGYALWGQFLDKTLEVKQDTANEFYKKLENSKSFDECMEAFPYKVMGLRSSIDYFLTKS